MKERKQKLKLNFKKGLSRRQADLPIMMRPTSHYSTRKVSFQLLEEISRALGSLDYGSVELYVANFEVTQITTRHIKKTNNHLTKIEK